MRLLGAVRHARPPAEERGDEALGSRCTARTQIHITGERRSAALCRSPHGAAVSSGETGPVRSPGQRTSRRRSSAVPSWGRTADQCGDPRYDEARNLPHVFDLMPDDVHEVVVGEGRSVEVVRSRRPEARILLQRGRSNATACGCAAVTGDIVVMLDAGDREHDGGPWGDGFEIARSAAPGSRRPGCASTRSPASFSSGCTATAT